MKTTRRKLRRLINEVLSYQRQTDLYNACLISKGIDPAAVIPSEAIASECFDEVGVELDETADELYKYYTYAARNSNSSILKTIKHLIIDKDYTFEMAKSEAEEKEAYNSEIQSIMDAFGVTRKEAEQRYRAEQFNQYYSSQYY